MKKRKGISLYELLIVMSIITLVAAISIPTIRNYLPSLQLSSTVREVISKLREAQEEAVTTQVQHATRFNPASNPVTIQVVKIGTPETVLQTITLPKNISITLDASFTSNQVIFSADGGPNTSGNITITQDTSSKIINLSPAGMIKMQ
ncbi:MAG: GspH/FimT family pseudopilin [Patescibacteria group bacterium]|jgi:Tfp pilus assembly protein FimT